MSEIIAPKIRYNQSLLNVMLHRHRNQYLQYSNTQEQN